MFHHAFPIQSEPITEWIAYHSDTLTPIRFTLGEDGHVHAVFQPMAHHRAPDTTVTASLTPGAMAIAIATEIKKMHPNASVRASAAPVTDIPEYLTAFDSHGNHPVVIRTADPVIIIRANDDYTLSADVIRHASTVPMPAEGWAYFWEDAARYLEESAPPKSQNPSFR